MIISREWAMPSKWTFSVPAFRELIDRYLTEGWIDPFAGENSPADVTNDIEGRGATHQMDGLAFLCSLPDRSAKGCLFDPPYSPEQCLRLYTPKQGGMAGKAEYWSRCKDEIARVVEPGGTVISFGWDSNGIGKRRGFEIVEVKLVCHGALHNDTIVTVERRVAAANEAFTPGRKKEMPTRDDTILSLHGGGIFNLPLPKSTP